MVADAIMRDMCNECFAYLDDMTTMARLAQVRLICEYRGSHSVLNFGGGLLS